MAVEPIRATTRVAPAPDEAFRAFTEGMAGWWPPEYTWSQAVLEEIAIEPREGGLCFERGPHGFRCDWGRVLAWEPPARLVFSWQIAPTRAPQPDPAQASEVEVRFTPDGDGTRVALEHRHFERHGDQAAEYRDGMGSPTGWDHILARFAGKAG